MWKIKVLILIRERSELSEAKRRRRHDRQIVERSEMPQASRSLDR
jgi:hypothetical protein